MELVPVLTYTILIAIVILVFVIILSFINKNLKSSKEVTIVSKKERFHNSALVNNRSEAIENKKAEYFHADNRIIQDNRDGVLFAISNAASYQSQKNTATGSPEKNKHTLGKTGKFQLVNVQDKDTHSNVVNW